MPARFETYEQFWPFYVSQHRHPACRALHVAGLSAGLLVAVLTAATSPTWLPLALVPGYGFAWVGHFFFERNRPATFTYPLWSLRGDFRMYRLTVLGRMEPELRRADDLFPSAA